jgi:hypothetical protein
METAITSGQQLLLPENSKKRRGPRQVCYAINSKDRNMKADADSNNFRWKFPNPLKDIQAVELLNGCIPADLYNVNTGWNQMTFGEAAGGTWTVTLRPGRYTEAELATELQSRLNALTSPTPTNTYTVAWSGITRKMTITGAAGSPVAFTFYFQTGLYRDFIDHNNTCTSINTPSRLLGFEQLDYTSDAGLVIVAPNRSDVEYCINRVYLHVNADNSQELTTINTAAGRRNCFAILYMPPSPVSLNYFFMNRDTHTAIYNSPPPGISRISNLTISIRDEFFRLIDLGKHDFTLMLEFTVLD